MMQNLKGSTSAPTLPSRGPIDPHEEKNMNDKSSTIDAPRALVASRRRFMGMTIAAAGTAATLPAVATAEASGKTSRLPQPLEQQLEACIENLKKVLAQLHPESEIEVFCRPDSLGGFVLVTFTRIEGGAA
jgi:hypothetical protein